MYHTFNVATWILGYILCTLLVYFHAHLCKLCSGRAEGRSENPGGGVSSNVVGIICLPLVEIGLTDLSKSGGPWQLRYPPTLTGLSLLKSRLLMVHCLIVKGNRVFARAYLRSRCQRGSNSYQSWTSDHRQNQKICLLCNLRGWWKVTSLAQLGAEHLYFCGIFK